MEAAMLKDTYRESESRMRGAIQSLEDDLAAIRTGRAHPALVEKIQVEYYGVPLFHQQFDSCAMNRTTSASNSPACYLLCLPIPFFARRVPEQAGYHNSFIHRNLALLSEAEES
jgi:hypothetical protein